MWVEVIRDKEDNCIVVFSIKTASNSEPYWWFIKFALAQTFIDKGYQ